MTWGYVAVGAGTAIAGGLGASSNRKARISQEEATRAALEAQRDQYNQSRADSAAYRQAGDASITRLGQLLGLKGYTAKEMALAKLGGPPDRNAYISGGGRTTGARYPARGISVPGGFSVGGTSGMGLRRGRGSDEGQDIPEVFDEAGYNSALEDYNKKKAEIDYLSEDPAYGSLNKKFTLADFWDDPVTQSSYQSGLDLGKEAIDRTAGAQGSRKSGATLKALTQFGTDYTGQKSGESYNRFYGDQDRIYNRLAGTAGTGQTAVANTSALGANYANNYGNLLTAQGNARGASAIAQGNLYGGSRRIWATGTCRAS